MWGVVVVVESRLHLENVVFALAEWIEDSALAGAPLASYAATQQETYRDPQTGPPVPSAMGQKRTFFLFVFFYQVCCRPAVLWTGTTPH